MEYTKGEWKVNDTGGNFLWVESNAVEHVICMVLQPGWTEIKGANYQYEEAKTNANLIAASPRMAELLQRLVNDGWSASISEEAKEILQTLA